MLTGEFDKPAGRTPMVTAPVTPFPADGAPEGAVLGGIRERLGDNPFAVDKDFGNSYSGIPHPITHQLDELMRSTYFVEWAAEQQPGTLALEREAVRMVASLLGAPEGAGFITSGGTESNLAALRLARYHGGQAQPEVVAPVTMHFSFRLGTELMRIGLVEVDVDPHRFVPRIEAVEQAITPRTVGLVCSAPAGGFGTLEPVEAFADLAQRKGLWLHVDAAFGGFMLPFKRDLGHRVEPFDFALPGVTSMMTRRPQAGSDADRHRFLHRPRAGAVRRHTHRGDPDPHYLLHQAGQSRGRRLGGAEAPRPCRLPPLDRPPAGAGADAGRRNRRDSGPHAAGRAGGLGDRLYLADRRPGRRASAHGRGRLGPELRRAARHAVHPALGASLAHPRQRPGLPRGAGRGGPPGALLPLRRRAARGGSP